MDISSLLEAFPLIYLFILGWISIASGFLVLASRKVPHVTAVVAASLVVSPFILLIHWMYRDWGVTIICLIIVSSCFIGTGFGANRTPFPSVLLFFALGSFFVLLSFLGLSYYIFVLIWALMLALLLYVGYTYHQGRTTPRARPIPPPGPVIAQAAARPVQRPVVTGKIISETDQRVLDWINEAIGLSTLNIVERQDLGDKLRYTLKDDDGNFVQTVAYKNGTVEDFVVLSGEKGRSKMPAVPGPGPATGADGAKMGPGSTRARFCRGCGQMLRPGERFCANCGKMVMGQ